MASLRKVFSSTVAAICLLATPALYAAPGDILFSDDFESGNLAGNWTVDNSGGGDAGVSTNNVVSGSRSMFTRWDDVVVTSNSFNANVPGANISVWIRRGDDDLDPDSEDTDNGENLVLEYRNPANNWVVLETFLGSGTNGQIYTNTYTIPAADLHANFALRFTQTEGSGGAPANGGVGWDYWHIDDVEVVETIAFNPESYYALDETSFATVVDGTGNGNDGSSVGNPAPSSLLPVVAGTPGTCGYADFPFNTSDNDIDAVDTGLDVNGIGNRGTISLWYKSNEDWNGNNGDRMLLDASNAGNGNGTGPKYFFLVLRNNSRLRFGLEDTSDGDFTIDTGNNNFDNDEWVHVAITWDMPGDAMQIYVNGSLAANGSPNTNGVLGDMVSLYLGDNRSTYQASGSSGRSANGSIDEVYIYPEVRSQAQIQADRDATHPCTIAPNTCGPIPSDYPLYSGGDDLEIDEDVTIDNGTTVETVEEGENNGNALLTDGDVITASNTYPPFEPSTFPATGSFDVNVSNGTTQTIDVNDNPPGNASYDDIRVRDDATVNFTGGGPFYIDRLRADERATINFDAGTYFIDRLDIRDDDVVINVNGPVRLYIGDRFTTGNNDDNLSVNAGGSVSDLVVFLYPNAEFKMDGENLTFNGVIYGPQSGEIDIEDNSVFTGAIIGGDEIDIGDDSQIIYTPAVAAEVASITTCLVSMDHYAIAHGGTGLTCAPTIITITAHDAGDNPVTQPAGTVINLSTSSSQGTWSGIVPGFGSGTLVDSGLNNGSATYEFPGGESSVQLYFDHFEVGTVNFDVSDGTYSESEDPDLVIARAGFLFSTIGSQISGKPSDTGFGAQNISIQAVRASDNDPAVCVPGFPDGSVRTVDLGAECNNANTCAGSLLSITNNGNTTAINTNDDNADAGTSNYTPVNLLFGPNATADIVLTYPDAGQMSLHAKYNLAIANPADLMNGTSGSSNLFVVRPFAYRLAVAGNPGETGVTEGVNIFRDAGQDFDIDLEAVVWQQADDSDNDGLPDNYNYTSSSGFSDLLVDNNITPNFGNEGATATLTPTVVAPAGGSSGTLSTASTAFTNGTSTTTTAWDEVGAMTIDALSEDYLGVTGLDIAGTSATIGRFHPAQYAFTSASVIDGISNAAGCASQTVDFTYSRQPFVATLTIEAQNADGGLTSNYQGSFATLSAADLGDTNALPLRNSITGTAYDTPQDGTFVTDFDTGTTGEAVIDVSLIWNMPVQIPTTTIITSEAVSTDDADTDGDASDTDIAMVGDGVDINNIGSTEVRYGRLVLFNAFGSELVPLAIPLRVESYQADAASSFFAVSSDDNCSTYDGTNPGNVLGNYTGNLDAGETALSGASTVAGGEQDSANSLMLSAPGETAGIPNTGSVDVTLDVPAWLEYDWNGGGDEDPTSTATFGIYSGSESTIFTREVY